MWNNKPSCHENGTPILHRWFLVCKACDSCDYFATLCSTYDYETVGCEEVSYIYSQYLLSAEVRLGYSSFCRSQPCKKHVFLPRGVPPSTLENNKNERNYFSCPESDEWCCQRSSTIYPNESYDYLFVKAAFHE